MRSIIGLPALQPSVRDEQSQCEVIKKNPIETQ
jgi:hypothetical protein